MTDDPGAEIGRLADEALRTMLGAVYPVAATLLGFREWDDRLPDHTEEGEAAYASRMRQIADHARRIDPGALTGQDQITRSVLLSIVDTEVDRISARAVEYTVAPSFLSPATDLLAQLAQVAQVALTDAGNMDGYLARLAGLPRVLAQITRRHRDGIAAGRVPVRRLVAVTVEQLDRMLADPAADPLRRPPPEEPAGSSQRWEDFRAEQDRLLNEEVRPAVRRYRDALAGGIAEHARPDDRPGLCWLPDGEAYYTATVRFHTTTDRTPEDLHRTGLDLIAALEAEYAEVGSRAFGVSDPAEVRRRLRDDPTLRWRDGDELIAHARATIARAEEAAPAWFGRLPSRRCEVREIPAAEAPSGPAAYYIPPALDGSRAGTYFANTYQAETRGRAQYEATAFHEAVPGHHLQLALAQELDAPLLRRLVPFNAYSEGWGLYAERLADEMGLYSDDVARLGMLNQDSMRAARLVVDTGLHALGWSRQQVVDYLRAYTAMPEVEIQSETDRYIAAPGQALSYMVGRLEIQRLRDLARGALGDRFDIRAFHDVVLGHGALPLQVLDEVVRRGLGVP